MIATNIKWYHAEWKGYHACMQNSRYWMVNNANVVTTKYDIYVQVCVTSWPVTIYQKNTMKSYEL